MTQHVELDHEDILHDGFLDPIQELLSAAAPNFRVKVKNATTLEIDAGTGNDQISIAIDGKYRYRSTDTTATLPGGLEDGEHPVFVTASDNDFSGPVSEPDKTVHTFGLEIKKTGQTPVTDLYRRVGTVTVKAEAITGFEQTVASVSGQQIESGALSGSGDLEWKREGGAWVPQLKASSVGSNELAALAVITAKVATEAIIAEKLATNAVEEAKIKALAVTTAKLAASAVTAEKIGNEAVEEAKIKALAVTAAKLAAESVTEAKLAASAVVAAKIAAEAVETAKIKNLAVTAAKIAAEAVETAKIANLAVTAAKLATNAVEEAKIKDGAATSRKVKLTAGIEESTADLVLTGENKDVPGASREITPAVASILQVTAVFDFDLEDPGGGGVFGVGILDVDGVNHGNAVLSVINGAGDNGNVRGTVAQVFSIPLTAAAHVVKMQARKEGVGSGECRKGNTNFLFTLVAS